MLVAAVDPEQLGVLPADPEDEGLAVDLDLEVVVGDPAAERLDDRDGARPEVLDDGVDRQGMTSTRPREPASDASNASFTCSSGKLGPSSSRSFRRPARA